MKEKLEISARIWEVTPKGIPLVGFWINNTRWEQVEHFLETGHWPAPEYVPGLLDRMSNLGKYEWLEAKHD